MFLTVSRYRISKVWGNMFLYFLPFALSFLCILNLARMFANETQFHNWCSLQKNIALACCNDNQQALDFIRQLSEPVFWHYEVYRGYQGKEEKCFEHLYMCLRFEGYSVPECFSARNIIALAGAYLRSTAIR